MGAQTDALLAELGQVPFTWGARLGLSAAELRDRYVVALGIADNDQIRPLLDFAKC